MLFSSSFPVPLSPCGFSKTVQGKVGWSVPTVRKLPYVVFAHLSRGHLFNKIDGCGSNQSAPEVFIEIPYKLSRTIEAHHAYFGIGGGAWIGISKIRITAVIDCAAYFSVHVERGIADAAGYVAIRVNCN